MTGIARSAPAPPRAPFAPPASSPLPRPRSATATISAAAIKMPAINQLRRRPLVVSTVSVASAALIDSPCSQRGQQLRARGRQAVARLHRLRRRRRVGDLRVVQLDDAAEPLAIAR